MLICRERNTTDETGKESQLAGDQLALYKCSQGVGPGTAWLKSSEWPERDLNSG